jgi:hypothetical protein
MTATISLIVAITGLVAAVGKIVADARGWLPNKTRGDSGAGKG